MRRSQFYIPTRRDVAKQESINAYLLTRAGYISQITAGAYALLPLAVRSIHKIEQIIREEMDALGGSEVIFTALQPKETWEKSGRWDDPNFRQIVYQDEEAGMTFGATHEEPMALVVKEKVQSYRDLPVVLYQFQTKFRKELRPKSGLLRGREFRMKDLYSFHEDEKAHDKFYEQSAASYLKVFERLGLEAYRVKASGGVFSSEFSDEFQVICPTGEDEVLLDHKTKTGFNKEVEGSVPKHQLKGLERVKAVEVGNIFHLGTKYPDAFDFKFLDSSGKRRSIYMGSYGIGITRLLGILAELNNDEHGLKLPLQVAPFQVVLVDLASEGKVGEQLYKELGASGVDVLYDDRDEAPGIKLVESDLIGVPFRVLHSQKTAQEGKVELKNRLSGKIQLVAKDELVEKLKAELSR
ncbi:MAG: prolyl-tRNA synthetase [Candidatus Berkelbacteria bacterium]|nr:MAG: prolyl-tRNA synthetase [Candidatus Berkelbacteria bacterium]QQG51543.1 MAG: prolyl-tRNA synthetase [Candidatus Berkelbacteria bacterium]